MTTPNRHQAPPGNRSTLPAMSLDGTSAVIPMILAEVAEANTPQAGDRLMPHIDG